MTRWRSVLGAALTAVLLGAALPAPASAAPGTAAQPPAQRLKWGACAGSSGPELRCARVKVPLDHRNPRGRKIEVMISRLPATDPGQRRGVLLSARGGPGQHGGVYLPEDYTNLMTPEVRARYDLIGFDVRFLEQSTPITCGYPMEEPEGFWNRGAQSRSEFELHVVEARQYARDCQKHAGWALPHATLANIARDMDVIRIALGERRISFLGADALGTVGAIYATLFPRQTDRFVLDNPLDPSKLWQPSRLERIALMESGLDEFAAWIADRDDEFGLGDTAAQVERNVSDMWKNAPWHAGGREWTGDELVYYTILGVFFDAFAWPMAANLAAIRSGDAPPAPWPLYPSVRPGVSGVPVDNHTAVSTAYMCAESPWRTNVESYWRDLQRYVPPFPNFGVAAANIFPCAFWSSRKDNRVTVGGRHTPPALVLGATGNSIVPLSNARAVATALRGSRLVVDDLRGHELYPFYGSDCLKDRANRYLISGELPRGNVRCPAPVPAG
ncbi:alpha/beta fold hydrolase [Micromonospora sp. WMMD1082]|uniref:alpha/beta fold hydrolase n=1 Tax=Micromonospora sp. WMMD1082 TaxID=3016104 RepID=UPI002417EEAD|nr:alpha/beta fold hydrolase [Micromonospora sp. WMMD1082]MDG4792792.1 alpha/beta fold hydrolase [Micromonospora sp. WMMD1082]